MDEVVVVVGRLLKQRSSAIEDAHKLWISNSRASLGSHVQKPTDLPLHPSSTWRISRQATTDSAAKRHRRVSLASRDIMSASAPWPVMLSVSLMLQAEKPDDASW